MTTGDRTTFRALVAEQSIEPRDRTLRALDSISTAALEAGSLEELLERLLHVLLDTAEAIDTAAILLRENGDLVLRGSVGLDADGGEESRVPVGEGFSGRIASSQQPMLLHVAASDPEMRIAAIRSKGVRALYGIPLVDRGRRATRPTPPIGQTADRRPDRAGEGEPGVRLEAGWVPLRRRG